MFNLFETAFSIELHVDEISIHLFYESFQVKVQSFIVKFIYIHVHICNMYTIYSLHVCLTYLNVILKYSMLDMQENMCIPKLDLMLQKSYR